MSHEMDVMHEEEEGDATGREDCAGDGGEPRDR